jgi:predicted RNase H-like HicB family nuclease
MGGTVTIEELAQVKELLRTQRQDPRREQRAVGVLPDEVAAALERAFYFVGAPYIERANTHLTATYVDGGDGWVAAWIDELPGVVTQGRTIEEARHNLREAAQLWLAANRDSAQEQANADGDVVLRREAFSLVD